MTVLAKHISIHVVEMCVCQSQNNVDVLLSSSPLHFLNRKLGRSRCAHAYRTSDQEATTYSVTVKYHPHGHRSSRSFPRRPQFGVHLRIALHLTQSTIWRRPSAITGHRDSTVSLHARPIRPSTRASIVWTVKEGTCLEKENQTQRWRTGT